MRIGGAKMINNISFSLWLILQEFRKNLFGYLKQYIILSLIFSLILIVYILPFSYEFIRLAPYKTAGYDVEISGFLCTSDYYKLMNSDKVSAVACADIWEDLVIVNPANDKKMLTDVSFIKQLNNVAGLLPDNPGLLTKGSFEDNCAVVTQRVADRLNLRIGDRIELNWRKYNHSEYKVRYFVSGIVHDSQYNPHIVAEYENSIKVLTNMKEEDEDGIEFTSMFIEWKKSEAIKFKDEDIFDILGQDKNITCGWRNDSLLIEQNEIGKMQSTTFKYTQAGIICIYILLFIGYLLIRIKQREKLYAILSVCGARNNIIFIHYTIDAFILFFLVVSTGTILAKTLMENFLLLYWPLNFISKTSSIFILNFITLIFISSISLWRLSKLPIADVLTKE